MTKKLICSKCRTTIVDFEKKKVFCTIEDGYDLRPAEIGFELELVIEPSLVCLNCGRKIPLSSIKHKSWYDQLMYLIKMANKFEGDLHGRKDRNISKRSKR